MKNKLKEAIDNLPVETKKNLKTAATHLSRKAGEHTYDVTFVNCIVTVTVNAKTSIQATARARKMVENSELSIPIQFEQYQNKPTDVKRHERT